jgi:hypothetical protein
MANVLAGPMLCSKLPGISGGHGRYGYWAGYRQLEAFFAQVTSGLRVIGVATLEAVKFRRVIAV